MPRLGVAFVLPALVLAGCTATGDADPFAYMKKPLYAGGFDLSRVAGGSTQDEFRVTDGSIGALRAFVWINTTAGSANVTLLDPSGRTVLHTAETVEGRHALDLGAWNVVVRAEEGTLGRVHVLVVRA